MQPSRRTCIYKRSDNFKVILSVKASKCRKTSRSCKETSETKGPSKKTADDVLAAISEKQWDVDCVQSFGQNIGENLVRTLVFHTISNEDCERKD